MGKQGGTGSIRTVVVKPRFGCSDGLDALDADTRGGKECEDPVDLIINHLHLLSDRPLPAAPCPTPGRLQQIYLTMRIRVTIKPNPIVSRHARK